MKRRKLTFYVDDGIESIRITRPAEQVTQRHKDVLAACADMYVALTMPEAYNGEALPDHLFKTFHRLRFEWEQAAARRQKAREIALLEASGQQRMPGT